MRATCPDQLSLIDLTTPTTYGEEYKLQIAMLLFWVVTPYRLAGRRFGETYCLTPYSLAGRRFGETNCLHLQTWRWKQYVSPKRWYLPTSLFGVATQDNNIVILTAMRTSNPTKLLILQFSAIACCSLRPLTLTRTIKLMKVHGSRRWIFH
jgi:hypothetical protein